MRVLYLISAQGTGLGGHFWSLRSLVEAIRTEVDCSVVNLGRVPVAAMKGVPVPYHDVIWRSPHIASAMRRLNSHVLKQDPDVLHSFDEISLFFARVMSLRHGKSLLHTKCGGPNPGGYFPRVQDMVLFSAENQEHFATDRGYRHSELHLIPNRVNELPVDPMRIARIKEGLVPGAVVFLRIARLSTTHEGASLQALNLVKQLRRDGFLAHFFQVGVVDSQSSEALVRAAMDPQDRLFTQPDMVCIANRLIDSGDFVVGTGRSLMEAASRGKILLAPLAGSQHPVLVTPGNVSHLSRTNFSSRGRIPGFDAEANYDAIRIALTSQQRHEELRAFARRMFDEDFSMAAAVPQYVHLYQALGPPRRHYLADFGRHAVRVLRRG